MSENAPKNNNQQPQVVNNTINRMLLIQKKCIII